MDQSNQQLIHTFGALADLGQEIANTSDTYSPLLLDMQRALGLTPWTDMLPKLEALQREFAHLLVMPEQLN